MTEHYLKSMVDTKPATARFCVPSDVIRIKVEQDAFSVCGKPVEGIPLEELRAVYDGVFKCTEESKREYESSDVDSIILAGSGDESSFSMTIFADEFVIKGKTLKGESREEALEIYHGMKRWVEESLKYSPVTVHSSPGNK